MVTFFLKLVGNVGYPFKPYWKHYANKYGSLFQQQSQCIFRYTLQKTSSEPKELGYE